MKRLCFLSCCALLIFPIRMAGAARYNNTLPSCESLGYVKYTSSCVQPVFCPFDTLYAACVSERCRGFVSKEEFDAENGDRCEVETCIKGEGNDTRTLYRCKECRGAFQAGRCLTECNIADFPYSSPPPDLYGTYLSCKDTTGTHYGYTSCYNGWEKKGARCEMIIADRNAYPYPEIETYESRGISKSFQSATNTYYGFSSCNSGYNLKTYGALTTGICVKQCELSNCREVGEVEGIKDYKCDMPSECISGDTITFQGKEIGMLLHKAESSEDHNLIIGTKVNKIFGMYGGHLDLSDDDGKRNTAKILEYCRNRGFDCPAVQYCSDYSVSGVTEPALAKGQWFLPSRDEMRYLVNQNVMNIFGVYFQYSIPGSGYVITASSYSIYRIYCFNLWNLNVSIDCNKTYNYNVFPMLSV